MSEDRSDIEMSSHLNSPMKIELLKEKKYTTKMMIVDALTELKTRKGVSVYAIKKHLTEKFQVNTERINFMIKKTLKTGVEDGSFIQLKGIGASGSFKLAPVKEKVKKPKKKKETEKIKEKIDKNKKVKQEKSEKKQPEKKPMAKKSQNKITVEKKVKKIKEKETPVEKKVKKLKDTKTVKDSRSVEEKVKKSKVKISAEGVKAQNVAKSSSQTPAKKRANMMKRKSVGSIIKPPKMKPK